MTAARLTTLACAALALLTASVSAQPAPAAPSGQTVASTAAPATADDRAALAAILPAAPPPAAPNAQSSAATAAPATADERDAQHHPLPPAMRTPPTPSAVAPAVPAASYLDSATPALTAPATAASLPLAPAPDGSAQTAASPPSAQSAAPAQAEALRLTLAEVEQLALAHNPTLVQAGAQVDAAKGRATQAGLLPNPTIGYAGEDLSTARNGRDVRGSHGFFVEQTIPLGGRLGRARTAFTREAEQADAIVSAQRQRVLTAVRLAYRDAVLADRRVAVREQLAHVAAEAVQVSAQLFNVGAADRPDTLAADIEARRAALALTEARNARVRVWRQLGALVGDPAFVPRPLAATVDDPLPALEQNAALARLLHDSPALKAAQAGVARAEAGVAAAQRAQAPELVLRAGSRYDRELIEPDLIPGGWGATVEAGVTVPLFNRNQGGVATAAADVARATAEVQRQRLALASRAAEALEQYDTARQAVTLYKQDILPRAEEAYTLYRASYAQMAAAYPQVLIAQRTLFQATDQYLDALGRAWTAAIRLDGFLLEDGLEMPAPAGSM